MRRMVLGGAVFALTFSLGLAARADDDEPKFEKDAVVYFYDINTAKWTKATVAVSFGDNAGLMLGEERGPLIATKFLITEEVAKKRGLAEDSSQDDRNAYVSSVHEAEGDNAGGSDSPLIQGVIKEHNEIRRDPKAYADKLEKEFEGQDLDPVTKKALETCLQDLRANGPLLPVIFSPEGSNYTKTSLALNGQHDNPIKIGAGWEQQGFKFSGNMLKFGGESIFGMKGGIKDEEEIGRNAVKSLLIDGGRNNEGVYGHRQTILNFKCVSVQPKPNTRRTEYRYIGVAFDENNVYIQYVCGQNAMADR
ncbi:MAG: hypothetical protein U0835_17700 [Isosphaeraceae bacterium]